MGLYNCARCDNWLRSEDSPPSLDPRMPATSTDLLCEDCSNEVETADICEAIDELFDTMEGTAR